MTEPRVKGEPARRPYDATTRRKAAADRRRAIVAAARTRFLRDGYAATTVAAVAEDAGVSVETVYKAFRNKPGLVRAVWDQALEGLGDVTAEARSDAVLERHEDARQVIREWAQLSAEVGARAAPVMSLLRSASLVDAEARDVHVRIEQARTRRMRHIARRLHDAGHLRPGLSVAHAADVMLAFTGWLYEPLALQNGWSQEEFVDLVERTLAAALLP